MTETDVLVVGAGPTGLTLAIELARRGVATRVIDRSADFHHHSRGKGIQPRSLEVFDDLGVVDEFLKSGMTDAPTRIHVDGRLVAELDLLAGVEPTADVPYPTLVLLPQWRTEQILRARLAGLGVHVELGRKLTAVEQRDDRVIAHLADGTTIGAAYLVGCDGGGSTVRDSAGIAFPGVVSDTEHYLLGDVEIDGLPRDTSHVWYGADNSSIGLALLPGTRAWQFGLTVRPGEEGAGEEPSLELFQRLFERRTGRTDLRLHTATWLSRFSYKVRLADRYRVGRVFIAGDAAHVHPIAGGLGMNTGIQDAYNLGWKLALAVQGRAPRALLDTYELERRPVAEAVLRTSGASMTALFSTKPLMTFLRDRVILPLMRRPAVTRAIIGRTSQLGVRYRDSPLSAGDRGRVAPGDRAPDSPLGPAGRRVFDALRGTHFTVLRFGAGEPVALDDAVRVCEVTSAEAAKRYGARPGTLFLVRPDGYVAMRTRSARALTAHLRATMLA